MTRISIIYSIVLLSLTCVTLSGCGIKPDTLQPPTPDKNKSFPAQYPQ